jgi:hypothetical protein
MPDVAAHDGRQPGRDGESKARTRTLNRAHVAGVEEFCTESPQNRDLSKLKSFIRT